MKPDRSIKDFLAEAEDILESANETLISLEEDQREGHSSPDAVNALFRAVHSFKGLAGMFELKAHSDVSHKLEFLLDELRLGKVPFSRAIVDTVFDTLALLSRLVQQSGKKQVTEDITSAIERIEGILTAKTATAEKSFLDAIDIDPGLLQVLTEYEEYRLKENIRERKNLFRIKATFDLSEFEAGIKNLNESLKKNGEIICTLPTSGAEGGIGFTIVVGTERSLDDISAALNMRNAAVSRIAYLDERRVDEAKADTGALRSVSNTVRVDIYKLDSLMNSVGEMHLAKNMIARIAKELGTLEGGASFSADLQKAHRNLERKLNDLQEGILEVRMVPIGQIFTRLTQMVRKFAQEAGKEIDLQFFGEDTELDKLMIEDLADPLMHLIRNAIDHGIEPPGVRREKGKPAQGVVRLSAHPKGNHVVITVEDDGAGMDPAAILAKAVEKGTVDKDSRLDLETDRNEIIDLIFLPGFTTRETVTELSGRGVGMDVVKRNISKLSGIINIETELGAGSSFVLTLPITLAIIKALIVEAGGQVFAVPLSSVFEIIRTEEENIETVETREVVAIRDETVPLIRLTEVFKLPPPADASLYLILVGLAERRLGIVVDGLRDQQEIVIKPLGKQLADLPGIAGATELGDKRGVVLVLDVESLLEETLKKTAVVRH